MADNVLISQGTGTTIASDQVGTAHYQRIKVTDGTADSENHWAINSAGAGLVAINGNSTVVVGSGVGNIGFATVTPSNTTRSITGNLTVAMPGGVTVYQGTAPWNSLVTVVNNLTIGNAMVTVTLGTKLDSTNDSVDIKSGATVTLGSGVGSVGFATVAGSLLDVRSLNSAATLYAVVNTTGGSSNVTLNPSPNYIGLVTVANNLTVSNLNSAATMYAVVNTSGAGANVTLNPSPNYIGLVTVANNLTVSNLNSSATLYAVVNTAATNGITTDSGVTVYQGSLPWNSLGTATVGAALPAGAAYIGLVTLGNGVFGDAASGSADSGNPVKVGGKYSSTAPTFTDGQRGDLQLGSRGAAKVEIWAAGAVVSQTTRADNADDVAVSATANNWAVINRNTVFDGTTWDRMRGDATDGVLVNLGVNNDVVLGSGVGGIGFATVAVGTALPAGANYIGLTTSWSRNAGTTKTLNTLPFAFLASIATIAVPTNANSINVTNMILSANATTQVRIKSGVTYLTGNASIGISLNPNGGFVLSGSPDSPSWIGLPSGGFVLEKNDVATLIGGHIVYFQE